MKLVQKHIVKGTRTFELVDDAVDVHIDMPFLDKEFTVMVAILDPEPVQKGSSLAFVSAVNREPLIELVMDKPDKQSFDEFVNAIRERAIAEDYGKPRTMSGRNVDAEQVAIALDMLRTYLGEDEHKPFLDSLEALKAEPENDDRFSEMYDAFNKLGPAQGAVLTYAPYINTLFQSSEQ